MRSYVHVHTTQIHVYVHTDVYTETDSLQIAPHDRYYCLNNLCLLVHQKPRVVSADSKAGAGKALSEQNWDTYEELRQHV